MVNRGKDFEDKIREALLPVQGLSLDRLPDQMSGFHASSNISDFMAYKFPFQYYLECKSTKENTFPFSNFTEKQWSGMIEKSEIPGVIAGSIIWFIQHDLTTFIDIRTLLKMQMQYYKSVNVKDIKSGNIDHIIFPGKKKKVFFDYEGTQFISNLEDYADKIWGDI